MCLFSETKTGRLNRSCLGIGTDAMEGGYKERVLEGEYGGNILYSCMKLEQ
jgi:hypothetical protein